MLLEENSDFALLQRIAAQCKSDDATVEETSTEIKTPFWTLPGFGAGARVVTSFGYVPIEALRLRDAIKTRGGRFLEVQHVDIIRLDRRFLLTNPDAQPIAIPKDGLAEAIPNQTILVSGCQKIRSPERCDQVSSRLAVDYVGRGNVARKYHGYFTYYVFHCGEPCTINVNGLWVDLDPDAFETPVD
jgi:hypothetical protein